MLDQSKIEAMRNQLKNGGVKVEVTYASSFFPTPINLAERMASMIKVNLGEKVLEPSAGSGNILKAAGNSKTIAIEIDSTLASHLVKNFPHVNVFCNDFLSIEPDETDWGLFDKVIMNPPFERGQDVDHVQHAFKFLKDGGQLAAIMCEGPFFRVDKKSVAFRNFLDLHCIHNEKLPQGSFKESGTMVNTRLIILQR